MDNSKDHGLCIKQFLPADQTCTTFLANMSYEPNVASFMVKFLDVVSGVCLFLKKCCGVLVMS